MDRTHSRTHLHQHSYNHVVRSASLSITQFGISFFILKEEEEEEEEEEEKEEKDFNCSLLYGNTGTERQGEDVVNLV